MSFSSISIFPVTRAIAIVSFIRLTQRRNVDFPQPDGPIKAVTDFFRNVEVHIEQRMLLAVEDVDIARDDFRALLPRRRCAQPKPPGSRLPIGSS